MNKLALLLATSVLSAAPCRADDAHPPAPSSLVAPDEVVRVTTEAEIARRRRNGVSLLTVGVTLTVIGGGLLAGLATCDGFSDGEGNIKPCSMQFTASGGTLAGVGLPVLTAGALLIADARRDRPVMTRTELNREIRRSRALALGGLAGYLLSFGTAMIGTFGGLRTEAGVPLTVLGAGAAGPMATLAVGGLARSIRLRRTASATVAAQPPSARRLILGGGISAAICLAGVAAGLGAFFWDPTRTNGAAINTGIALMAIGSIGFVPSFAVFIDGLVWRRRLQAGRVATREPALTMMPWAARQAAGLRLAGSF